MTGKLKIQLKLTPKFTTLQSNINLCDLTRKHNYKIPNSEEGGQRSIEKMKALN